MARKKTKTEAERDPFALEVGARVKALREGMGKSIYWLADAARTSASTVSNTEAGKSLPGLDLACRLADALGCSLGCLAGREK